MKINNRAGFTLLEVMIFIMILSMVLVTATSFITKLLVNIRSNEHRANAAYLADDVKEWLNGEREANPWNTFSGRGSAGGGTRYCLNNAINLNTSITQLPSATYPAAACTANANIQAGFPPIYRRELVLTTLGTPPTQVTATIQVFWVDNGTPKNVTIQSIYSSPF